jgi:trimeric autotransporter adhesin
MYIGLGISLQSLKCCCCQGGAPVNTVSVPSSSPTLCIDTELTAITHNTTGATGIGTATGLPTGVTATWSADVITINGTPTEAGTFNYSIPLTGGYGSVNATGAITVLPANTVSEPSSTPTVDYDVPITPITFTTTGATGIGTVTGLPAGLTASFASNTITVSGTPAETGTFNYSIPLTGGCNVVTGSGSLTVDYGE